MDVKTTDEIYKHYRTTRHDALFVAQEWDSSPAIFSVLKYLQRAGKKDGNSHVQDMLKAVWYLTYETASRFMPHEERSMLADAMMSNLRNCLEDYGCQIQTGEEQDSSDSQSAFDFPFVQADDSPD